MNQTLIVSIAGVICAVLTFLEIRSAHRNRQLRNKLRRAYLDLLAFYEIEQRLCSTAADAHFFGSFKSTSSVKRTIRASIREDGMESPSDEATPYRIGQELQKL